MKYLISIISLVGCVSLANANQNCYISSDGVVVCSNRDGSWGSR